MIRIILLCVLLGGCTTTRLVPQVYMPTPPDKLMEPPRTLTTIGKINDATTNPSEKTGPKSR